MVFLILAWAPFAAVGQGSAEQFYPQDSHSHNAPPPDNVHFDRLSVADGLPNRHVNDIHQDRYGYIWLATRDGLARFDGKRVITYLHDPAIPNSLNGNWLDEIYETRSGDLWLKLGVGGLDRLDRAAGTFTHYQPEDDDPTSLSGSVITAFLEDQAGNLWIGTQGSGISFMPVGTDAFQRFRHQPTDPEGLPSDAITAVAEDADGRLWIGTCGGGLSLYQNGVFRTWQKNENNSNGLNDSGLNDNCVNGLTLDPSGRLWILTQHGLSYLKQENGDFSFSHRLMRQNVTDVAFTSDGRVWAVASSRLFSMLPEEGRPRLYLFAGDANAVATSVLVDQRDIVWIGSLSGLFRYHHEADQFDLFRYQANDPHSLSGDVVNWIFEDRAGALWFGTHGHGISRFARSRWKLLTYRRDVNDPWSLSHNEVTSMVEDPGEGGIWVGTFGGGLSFFDPRVESFTNWRHYENDPTSLTNDTVNDLTLDARGNLWVATAVGLDRRLPDNSFFHYRAEPGSENPTNSLSANFINALALAPDDSLWIAATDSTLHRMNPDTGEMRRYFLQDPTGKAGNVWTVHVDARGRVWAGMAGIGLMHLDPQTGDVLQYIRDREDPGTLNNRTIHSILDDREGRLWIGTFSGGIDLFNEDTGTFEHFTMADGLPSNRVTAIIEDHDGRLWLGTGHGIVHFNPERRDFDGRVVRIYDRTDGLLHEEINMGAALRAADGNLYFGGPGGLARLRPGSLTLNPNVPPVVLTGIRFGEEKVPLEQPLEELEKIRVAPSVNSLTLEFAALDFAQPERNQYRYKLEGLNDDWVDNGNDGRVTFTNLDPGGYTFRVRASNNDEVWNNQGLVLKIRVMPPFWGTWWFKGLLALAIASLLALAFVGQRRRLESLQREELRARDLQRKTEELETARRVQLSMLPRRDLELPFGGNGTRLQAVGRMVTAAEVGGDYYDFITPSGTVSERSISDGLVVACGDAIGHGTAAGLVVGMAKAAIRHELLRGRPDLREVLTQLNITLGSAIHNRQSGMGLALLRVVAAEGGATVEMASTAMPPVYLYAAREERLLPYELPGLPLGLVEGVNVQEQRAVMEPGDVLIIMSDGLAERLDQGGDVWGYESLESALKDACANGCGASTIADRVVSDCHNFAGDQDPQDDMTVVVVRLTE